jgi:hypothetical protein
MSASQCKSRSRGLRGSILGVICILLITFNTTIQAIHTHDVSGNAHPDCSLCMVAHAGVASSAPVVAPIVFAQVDKVEVSPAEHPRYFAVLFFYSRPPPVGTASL